ncbi:regulatory protein YycH of two-component signal transduction system YycFG [Alkalibacillus flavidus]|uniref:Regulatory protein YycH of two-component signal transduction system YycFG n=1 Tax=Alkalibacillus flavidus TaxID=546021 RepID=A0ABV2KWA4_9BACI
MTKEHFKSGILFILVISSLGLTFALWTYQPQYEEPGQITYLEETELDGKQKVLKDVVLPDKMIFNQSRQYSMLTSKQEEKQLFNDMSEWTFSEIDQFPTNRSTDVWNPNIELVMPTEVPFNVISRLFNVDELDYEGSDTFNRIFFQLTRGSEERIRVSFTSDVQPNVLNGRVDSVSAYDQLQSYFTENDMTSMERVQLHEDQAKDYVYVTNESISLPEETVLVDRLDRQPLINVLFNNPSLVRQQNSGNSSETYLTDGTRLLRLNDAFGVNQYASYHKPPSQETNSLTHTELLLNSLSHTNDYLGWTDDFRVNQLNESNQVIQYRNHFAGYPIFDRNGYMTMQQEWSNIELQSLSRPLFKLTAPFQQGEMIEIDSGVSVHELLHESSQSISWSLVSDIQLGYDISAGDGLNNVLFLEPTWFIQYAGIWRPLEYFNERITLQEDG